MFPLWPDTTFPAGTHNLHPIFHVSQNEHPQEQSSALQGGLCLDALHWRTLTQLSHHLLRSADYAKIFPVTFSAADDQEVDRIRRILLPMCEIEHVPEVIVKFMTTHQMDEGIVRRLLPIALEN